MQSSMGDASWMHAAINDGCIRDACIHLWRMHPPPLSVCLSLSLSLSVSLSLSLSLFFHFPLLAASKIRKLHPRGATVLPHFVGPWQQSKEIGLKLKEKCTQEGPNLTFEIEKQMDSCFYGIGIRETQLIKMPQLKTSSTNGRIWIMCGGWAWTLTSVSALTVGMLTQLSKRKPESTKPITVGEYNVFMNGCDRADHMVGYYVFGRKTYKWWKKLF